MLARMSSGRAALLFVSLLVVAGLLGARFVPLPRTVRCEYQLVAAGRLPVSAPFDGVVLEVADAGAVEAGVPLARYDVSTHEERRAELERRRDELVSQLESPVAPELRAAVADAERAEKAARDALKKAGRGQRPAAQAELDRATRALAAAREAARPTPNAQLEGPLSEVNAQLAALAEQLEQNPLVAPRAGVFAPSVKPGDAVTAKQPLGELVEASTLMARVKLPDGEIARQGRVITLIFPLARKSWALTEDGRDGFVSVEVPNADGALKAGATGVAELEGEPRPLLP